MNKEVEKIVAKARSNLALARFCLSKERRDDLSIFYAFCRVVDDLADDEGLALTERVDGLQRWREVLRGEEKPGHFLEREVLSLQGRRDMKTQYFLDLIDGCEMDLQKLRFGSWEELQEYTYRVAGTVGLLCLPIFGADEERCEPYARTLADALQLTNILRDVGEDLANGNRIYLPLLEFTRFQYSERDLIGRVYDGRFVAMMEYHAQRAESLFEEARKLFPQEDAQALLAAELMGEVYSQILHKMKEDRFRVFEKRYRLGKLEKSKMLTKALWRGRKN